MRRFPSEQVRGRLIQVRNDKIIENDKKTAMRLYRDYSQQTKLILIKKQIPEQVRDDKSQTAKIIKKLIPQSEATSEVQRTALTALRFDRLLRHFLSRDVIMVPHVL